MTLATSSSRRSRRPRLTALVAEADALRPIDRGRPRALAVGGQLPQADRLSELRSVARRRRSAPPTNPPPFRRRVRRILLLPSSANRRVALFARDLIICLRTTCGVVRQCSRSGGAHVRPPSPSIPSEQRGANVDAVADRALTYNTCYIGKILFLVLQKIEPKAVLSLCRFTKLRAVRALHAPADRTKKLDMAAAAIPSFAARPSPTYISAALRTGLEDLFDPLRARRDLRASLRLGRRRHESRAAKPGAGAS